MTEHDQTDRTAVFFNFLRVILAAIAGEAMLVFRITIVHENIFGGISLTVSPFSHVVLGGAGTFLSAFLAGLAAYLIVGRKNVAPHIIISLLIVVETSWLIMYSNTPDPLWFDLLASFSLIVGIWLGVGVFKLKFSPLALT